jgi:hypothetical protein
LLAGVASLAAYGFFAQSKAESRAASLGADASGLRAVSASIASAFKEEEAVDKERQPMMDALAQRRAWPEMLAKLNAYFASDVLWVTDVEPLKDGEGFLADLIKDPKGSAKGARKAEPAKAAAPGDKGKAPAEPVVAEVASKLRVRGLWRSSPGNPDAGQDKAREIFDAIHNDKDSPFSTSQMDQAKDLNVSGRNEDTFAWPFELVLPLKSPLPID